MYKVLGQSKPTAATNADLYTVPAGKEAVVSTLSICNQGASASFRVAVRPAGATLADQHYIVYDAALNASDALFLTVGLTLEAGDVVTVYVNTANVSFGLFGSEI